MRQLRDKRWELNYGSGAKEGKEEAEGGGLCKGGGGEGGLCGVRWCVVMSMRGMCAVVAVMVNGLHDIER